MADKIGTEGWPETTMSGESKIPRSRSFSRSGLLFFKSLRVGTISQPMLQARSLSYAA